MSLYGNSFIAWVKIDEAFSDDMFTFNFLLIQQNELHLFNASNLTAHYTVHSDLYQLLNNTKN